MTWHLRSTSRSEVARPATLVVSLWLVAIVLTGYCSSDLQAWVHGSAALETSGLVGVTDQMQVFGDTTGLNDVHDRLERVRERIHKGDAARPTSERVAPPRVAAAGATGAGSASAVAGSANGSGTGSASAGP